MEKYYIHDESLHNLAAPAEVVPFLIEMFNPQSVLDVGCGLGSWLKLFSDYGVSDFIGIDGSYVDTTLLKIPTSKFRPVDLRHEWSLERKFDIVLCLEVAEHLPENCANDLVASLVRCSDVVIFSAAIPGQGGQNHVNEQWPEYWASKFLEFGYNFHDVIRPVFWNNDKVNWFYRQNMFVVSKNQPTSSKFLSVVHPVLFHQLLSEFVAFKEGLFEGRHGLLTASKIMWSSLRFKLKNTK